MVYDWRSVLDAAIQCRTAEGSTIATIRLVDPPEPRYFSASFVTRYLLEEENAGTRLSFSESRFDAWPDDEVRRARFDRISVEFRMVLENLNSYLEGNGDKT